MPARQRRCITQARVDLELKKYIERLEDFAQDVHCLIGRHNYLEGKLEYDGILKKKEKTELRMLAKKIKRYAKKVV